MLRNKQHWMKYLYWAVNKIPARDTRVLSKRCIGYSATLFEKWCPHIVVSVHPLTQHIFGRILRELNLTDTDPARHRRHRSVLRILERLGLRRRFALSGRERRRSAAADRLRRLAGEDQDLRNAGRIQSFTRSTEADAQIARQAYGLDPDKFTVFVNAGWIGGGNIPQIFRELVRGELDVQAIFLAGKNEELREEAEADCPHCKVSRSRSSAIRTRSKS